MRKVFPLIVIIFAALAAISENPPTHVGKMADGSSLLTTGWRVAPEGIQIPLDRDTYPMNFQWHPDGKHLFIVNSGYRPPSVLIIDTSDFKSAIRVAQPDAWLGLAINKAGDKFYVPQANLGSVREFSFAAGQDPKPLRSFQLFPVPPAPPNSRDGKVPVRLLSKTDYLGDAVMSADGKFLYVANMQNNLVHVIDLATGDMSRKWTTGTHPYKLLPVGERLYVSNWGASTISMIDVKDGKTILTFDTGGHPTAMLLHNGRLYVTCSNTNFVYVHDPDTGIVREKINVALHPKSPPGTTPNFLAASPDGKRLFVANADNNTIAVIDVPGKGEPGGSTVAGFIPTGWYPMAVAISADGRRVFIANGKGERSYPNPENGRSGPSTPIQSGDAGRPGYGPNLQKGSISIVDMPQGEQLAVLTRRAVADSPYRDELLERAPGQSVAIPTRPGDSSPIQHVIYIIRENRTYDQILGDMKEGNGDPSLCFFCDVTPNAHKLAREFVLLDNFYVNSDVSADGHAWSMGAIANDFTAKLWPSGYGGRRNHYDSEGDDDNEEAGGGWLFTNAIKKGVPFRDYGEWLHNNGAPPAPTSANDKVLNGHFDPAYRGWDLEYPDQKRIDEWQREFAEFEKNGNLPKLEIVRIGNDHTNGTRPGGSTPRALVADNDYALGRLVDTVSHSRYWNSTAIFVVEDDAQSGPDHVDSHRSPGFVISSWTHKGATDSTMYSTVSMLRTMGLILGLPPMSQYDGGAMPMHSVFMDKPDVRPYEAAKPAVDLEEKNKPTAPMAKESAALDFSEADRVDDDLMNRILWAAVKGNQPRPAPVRSVFPALWILHARR